VLDPRAVAAHYGLAHALMQGGDIDTAAEHYRRVLALKPDFAEACNNLGIVLAAKGETTEAAALYQRALALKPELIDVYRNFGRMLLAQGEVPQALALARRALAIKETEEARAFFVQCAKRIPANTVDAAFAALIARALAEGWSRPSELAPLAAEIFKQSAAGGAAVARAVAAWPARLSAAELWGNEFAAIAADGLLRALLESAPVQDIALERFLTAARSVLLEMATAQAASAQAEQATDFFCALARQCFINEYVFAVRADEQRAVGGLRADIDAALAAGATIPALRLAALSA
jgi:Tfp pilus assembly protein PilF